MTVEYNSEIEEQILSYLDGWEIKDEPVTDEEEEELVEVESVESNTETEPSNTNSTDSNNTGEVQPFIDNIVEYKDNPNKKITSDEVEKFYESALQKAYIYCNRLNVDDLTSIEEEMFIKGVCCWTASDLWNKYNIRVNNEDMEDVYVQSYGGLLYKQSINILKSFINQRVYSLTGMKKQNSNNDDIWII